MNPLKPLQALMERCQQPAGQIVWLGLGTTPPKRNALLIDTDRLPTDDECSGVAGLDVVLSYHGYATRYGTLARLCGSLYQARPRRLQIIDLDLKRIAFIKIAGRP